jgi:hypothetical protein
MERRDCYGSIREITLNDGKKMAQSRPECRNCEEIRDCLRTSRQIEEERRERDELRKQNLISKIIDLSQIFSNEIGACLLEFLSRIYSSPLGMILFRNLLLFYEAPRGASSSHLTVPMSQATLDLLQREGETERTVLEEGRSIRIVLFQKSFPNQPKANMGMIAHEVALAFVSDQRGIKQILQILSDSEATLFKKMDVESKARWVVEKWGFGEDLEVFRKETAVDK